MDRLNKPSAKDILNKIIVAAKDCKGSPTYKLISNKTDILEGGENPLDVLKDFVDIFYSEGFQQEWEEMDRKQLLKEDLEIYESKDKLDRNEKDNFTLLQREFKSISIIKNEVKKAKSLMNFVK